MVFLLFVALVLVSAQGESSTNPLSPRPIKWLERGEENRATKLFNDRVKLEKHWVEE